VPWHHTERVNFASRSPVSAISPRSTPPKVTLEVNWTTGVLMVRFFLVLSFFDAMFQTVVDGYFVFHRQGQAFVLPSVRNDGGCRSPSFDEIDLVLFFAVGGLVNGNSSDQGLQYHEWTSFISDNKFCFRACVGARATNLCNDIYDVMGCYWVRFSNTSLTTLPCSFTDNQYFLEHSRQPQRQPIRRLHW